MNELDFVLIIPELFIACSAIILLMVGAYSKGDAKILSANILKISIVVLLLAGFQLLQSKQISIGFSGLFIQDNFSVFSKLLILLASIMVLMLSLRVPQSKYPVPFEYAVLLLFSIVGMMVMVSANDLMTLYMGLELQSLSLYVLTAIRRDDEKSSEAAMKYFMLGALSSGLLLFGASLIYGFTSTTNFVEIASALKAPNPASHIAILFGLILLVTGILFKLSAVPFHMWVPDVYEGAPKSVTAFFATAPKVAAFSLLVRLLYGPFIGLTHDWQQVIVLVSVLSMLVGAFGALRQQNIKRLMAYSSIGHIGFLLVGIAAATKEGVQGSFIYLFIYVIMNAGTFACIMLMKRHKVHLENIGELSGLAKNKPFIAFILAALMLSMAGIPPLAGFFGKFFVFNAAIKSGLYALSIVGVLSSVVGAFYYLRIIKIMYFDEANEPFDNDIGLEMKLLLTVTALFNLLFFINPEPLIHYISYALNGVI